MSEVAPKKKKQIYFTKLAAYALSHTKKILLFLTWWSKVNEMTWPCFREQLFWSRGIPFYFIEIENFGGSVSKPLNVDWTFLSLINLKGSANVEKRFIILGLIQCLLKSMDSFPLTSLHFGSTFKITQVKLGI